MAEPEFTGQIAYHGLAPASALTLELVEYTRKHQIVRLYCVLFAYSSNGYLPPAARKERGA